jgi:hypothetical protein
VYSLASRLLLASSHKHCSAESCDFPENGCECASEHSAEHGTASFIQRKSSMGSSAVHTESEKYPWRNTFQVSYESSSSTSNSQQVLADLNNSKPTSKGRLVNLLGTASDGVSSKETQGLRNQAEALVLWGRELAPKPVATLMISALIIICLIYGMTHSVNDRLADVTFVAVDNFLAVFLAVLWFQALHAQINDIRGLHSKILASFAHALCCLFLFVSLAFMVSRRPAMLATVASCGGYIIAFASTHAAYVSQKYNFSMHWLQCLIGIGMLMLVMFLLAITFHFVWKSFFHEKGVESDRKNVNDWAEHAESMENDFAAMPIAVALIELVHYLLDGEYPDIRGNALNYWNTRDERVKLLAFGIFLLALACLAVPFLMRLQRQKQRPYPQRRTIGFMCSLMAMLVAWAFIDWGQWQMYDEFESDPIYARIVYADICTAAGLLGICLLSMPPFARLSMNATEVAVRALSLVVAWSWEQAFDQTMEHARYKTLTKPLVVLVFAVIVVPFMMLYTKPVILSIHKLQE